MPLDLDADLALVDGVESATIRLLRPDEVTEHAAEHAVRADLNRALRSFSGIEIRGDETAWELPDVLPAGEALSPDDEIVDAACVTYVVVSAIKRPLDAGWSAIARPKRRSE